MTKVTTALNLLLQQRVLPLYRENALSTNNAQCKHAHIINTTDPRNSAGALSDSGTLSLLYSLSHTESLTHTVPLHLPSPTRRIIHVHCAISRVHVLSLSPSLINRCAKVLIYGKYLLFLLFECVQLQLDSIILSCMCFLRCYRMPLID